MPRRVRLDPELTAAPIRTREHARWGVTESRLRSPDVAHPFHGVNVVGPASPDALHRARAYVPLLRAGDAFSHVTAAELLGVPLPSFATRDGRIHVVAIGGHDRPLRRGIVGHRTASGTVVEIEGLPVVAPTGLWFQLAEVLHHDDLIAAGDFLVTGRRDLGRRCAPLTTIADLERTRVERAGRRGTRVAARALPWVRVGPDSRPETLLRLLLVRAGFPEPEIAHGVDAGGRILHPDLSWPQWRVALEYEGDGHRTDQAQWRRDIARREDFEAVRWRVIRVTADDLRPRWRGAFLERVERVIRLNS